MGGVPRMGGVVGMDGQEATTTTTRYLSQPLGNIALPLWYSREFKGMIGCPLWISVTVTLVRRKWKEVWKT
jgi:hypothetical protein